MNARVFIKAIWDKIENRYKGKTKLLFSANRNNCSIMPSKRYIIVGLAYAKNICNENGEDISEHVLAHSIGHELTHKGDKYFYRTAFPVTKKYSVISKINEVHADYGGAMIAKLSKDDFVKVMEIKWGDMSDKESGTHPSHRQRIKYAKIGRFDNGLIQIICNDNGYKESKEFYGMYDDIRLE